MTDRELLVDLMNAAQSLWQIVKFRDEYGETFFVVGDSGKVPYEKALTDALNETEKALQAAGIIYVR